MAWTGRGPAIGMGVLALHALLIAFLIRAVVQPAAPPPEREIQLVLVRLAPAKPVQKKPRLRGIAATPRTITLPRFYALPPVSSPPDTALPGLGATFGCSASNYDTLSTARRAACGHGPWQFDRQARETAALSLPPPPHQMTPAEIAEHTRNTTDPCLAEKAAHLQFCIYKIIYGDKLP
jgi:hypothetical protein